VPEPKRSGKNQAEQEGSGLAERAGKLVDDLAKRGETRTKDIQKAARGIADRSARDRRDLMRLIQKEIRRQVEALGLARNADVEKLDRRVKELEKPAAKKSPAKRKPAQRKKSQN
jgi:polyhydroxyalkanoate synthesis regulator phasin